MKVVKTVMVMSKKFELYEVSIMDREFIKVCKYVPGTFHDNGTWTRLSSVSPMVKFFSNNYDKLMAGAVLPRGYLYQDCTRESLVASEEKQREEDRIEEEKSMLAYREAHFDLVVCDPNHPDYDDEVKLSITHNGSQWESICLSKVEAKRVVDALVRHYNF